MAYLLLLAGTPPYRIKVLAEIMGFTGAELLVPLQVTALAWARSAMPTTLRQGRVASEAAAACLNRTHGADVYQTDIPYPMTVAGPPTARSTTSVTPTWPGWSPPSRIGNPAGSTSSSPTQSTSGMTRSLEPQNYVANYASDYPVTEVDIPVSWRRSLPRRPQHGQRPYNPLVPRRHPRLCPYGTVRPTLSHVRRLLTDATCGYCDGWSPGRPRLRAARYRDRRYLLYSPLTKAKVTEGEAGHHHLWDVTGPRREGTRFSSWLARRWAAQAEGTVHQHVATRRLPVRPDSRRAGHPVACRDDCR